MEFVIVVTMRLLLMGNARMNDGDEGCWVWVVVVIMGWDDAKVALIAFCSGPWLLF